MNIPFIFKESPDKVIISIIDINLKGQFVFPKKVLHDKKILSSSTSKGKMAKRVYPTWINNLNYSAKKSQNWQSKYFVDLSKSVDKATIKELYFDNYD